MTYERNRWNNLTINHSSIILFIIAFVSLITIYSKFLALSCLQTSQFLEDKILIFCHLDPRLTNWQFNQVQSITGHYIRMRCWGLLSFKICLKIFQDLSQYLFKFRVSLPTTFKCVGGGFYPSRWWLNLEMILTFVSGLQIERKWHLCLINFCIGLAKRKNTAFVLIFGQ